jgi:hypothetical protein
MNANFKLQPFSKQLKHNQYEGTNEHTRQEIFPVKSRLIFHPVMKESRLLRGKEGK